MAETQFEHNSRADLEMVERRLVAEFNKPADQRDQAFIREGVATIEAFEKQAGMGGTGTALAQQSPESFSQETGNFGQLFEETAAFAAKNRLEDMGDFMKRPFMEQPEQDALANRRRVERATKQLDLDAKIRRSGGDPEAFRGAPQTVAGLVPDAVIGAIPGFGQARSVLGSAARIAGETGVGAVLGGSTVPLDEDPTSAAAIGGGLGLGLGIISEIPGAGQDFLRRELRAAKNSNRDARLQAISEDAGIDLSLGERTGAPAVGSAEQGVQGRPGGARDTFLTQRNQQIEARFDQIIDALNPSGQSTTQVVQKTKEAYDETISTLSENASRTFRDELRPSLPAIGSKIDDEGRIVGGFKFIETPELQAELATQLKLLTDQPLSGASETARRQLLEEIKKLRSGKLDLGQAQRLLADLSGKNKPSGIVIKDNSQAADILSTPAVQRALNRDLDNIAQGDDDFATAVEALQMGRFKFGKARADIDVFKNRAVDKLLGKVGDPSAEDFGKRVLAMDKRSFDEMLEIADAAGGGLGAGIRGAVLEELVDKHRFIDAGRSSVGNAANAVDTPALIQEIVNMPFGKFTAFISADIEPVLARQIHSTLVSLQAISEGPLTQQLKSGAKNMRERFEQYAINAASQDAGFISRLLAGELAPGAMERLLFSPEGQHALSRLGQPRLGRAEFAQSANFVVSAMAEDEKFKQELASQRGRQQTMQNVGNIQ